MKYLIVGLGNPGDEYKNTRHNIGFIIADALAASGAVSFRSERYGSLAEMKIRGRQLFVLKPTTFMNLSGKAVRYWMEKEKISLENLLVVLDDVDLEPGVLRMRTKGTGGTHNGINNIIEVLQSSDFPRLRVGIGHNYEKGRQVDYVLGEWTAEERAIINKKADTSVDMIKSFVMAGARETMTLYNNK